MRATFLRHGPFLCGYEAGCGLNQEVSSMSLGQAIAPHLPYLRRYGRAISGSQTRGDRLAARLLETLVADPGPVAPGADLRIQLFRTVTDDFGVATAAAAAAEAAGAAERKSDGWGRAVSG